MAAISPTDSTFSNRSEVVGLCAGYAAENENPPGRQEAIVAALGVAFREAPETIIHARLCIEYAHEERPDVRRDVEIRMELGVIFNNAIRPAILAPPKITGDKGEAQVTYADGQGIRLNGELGHGMSKTVFQATGLKNGKVYAAAFVEQNEIDTMLAVKGKRGVAQICKHVSGTFGKDYKNLMWMEKYGDNLEQELRFCNLADLKVVVKDLVYAVIALEGEDPQGLWIEHGDVKLANVLLKQNEGRVTGAYLIDFGSAAFLKTPPKSNESIEEQFEKYGGPLGREGQRLSFMQWIFHPLKERLARGLKSTLTLTELCADDPQCHKVMEAMEKEYDYVFDRRYRHMAD